MLHCAIFYVLPQPGISVPITMDPQMCSFLGCSTEWSCNLVGLWSPPFSSLVRPEWAQRPESWCTQSKPQSWVCGASAPCVPRIYAMHSVAWVTVAGASFSCLLEGCAPETSPLATGTKFCQENENIRLCPTNKQEYLNVLKGLRHTGTRI